MHGRGRGNIGVLYHITSLSKYFFGQTAEYNRSSTPIMCKNCSLHKTCMLYRIVYMLYQNSLHVVQNSLHKLSDSLLSQLAYYLYSEL